RQAEARRPSPDPSKPAACSFRHRNPDFASRSPKPGPRCPRPGYRVKSGLKVVTMRTRHILALCGLSSLFLIQPGATADDDKKSSGSRETISKPLSERQKKRAEERLKKELETPYKKWLNEEVIYIISDEERKAFSRFQTDEERQQFVEQ